MASASTSLIETSNPGGTLARSVDQATNSLHGAIDRASDAALPAVDQLAIGAHQAVERLAVSAGRAAERMDTKSRQLLDARSRFAERCSARIRDKPVAALGIAVGAGLLISWLLRSR